MRAREALKPVYINVKRELEEAGVGGSTEAGLKEEFERLSDFGAFLEKETRWIAKALEGTLEMVLEGRRKLASRYLELRRPEWGRRKLRALCRENSDVAFWKALWFEAREFRNETVRRAVREGRVRWAGGPRREEAYGAGLDDRVIELPLAFECAALDRSGRVLDAGAALNSPLRDEFVAEGKAKITHFTQSGFHEEARFRGDRVSYLFGDLRAMDFKDGVFDRVVCVSTLEHIGMDNTRYGGPKETHSESFVRAFAEMLRVLAPEGLLFITVPYGEPRDLGWYRVFGRDELGTLLREAAGNAVELKFYRYEEAWYEVASAEEVSPPGHPTRPDDDEHGLLALRVRKGASDAGPTSSASRQGGT